MPIPGLPASLHQFTIAHISDLHLHRGPAHRDRAVSLLAARRVNLVAITGDLMIRGKPIEPALRWIDQLVKHVHAPDGYFGCTGNHDTDALRDRLGDTPVRWLRGEAWAHPTLPLDLLGRDTPVKSHRPDDAVPMLRAWGRLRRERAEATRRVRLMLCHVPEGFTLAADLGVDLMLAGHTHGGQIRLPMTRPPMPVHRCGAFGRWCASGLLRQGESLCAVSRGLGKKLLLPRLFCPPQLGVYHLVPGELPGTATPLPRPLRRW